MRMPMLVAACALSSMSQSSIGQESFKGSPGIEVGELLGKFAKRHNRQFVIDSRVRGAVSLVGIDPAELRYDQLQAVLNVQQAVVMDSGGILVVLPDVNARQLPSPTYLDASFKAADQDLVTLVLTPKRTCAKYLVPVLRPLMPQAAHLAAEVQSNSLIINDRAVNVRRIAGMVEALDKRTTSAADCNSLEMGTGGVAIAPATKPAG